MASALDALFGYGRYKCLGRSIAFMELNKSLPEVCLSRVYEFSRVLLTDMMCRS